jgi:hypothetical protein
MARLLETQIMLKRGEVWNLNLELEASSIICMCDFYAMSTVFPV